jgi:RNA polymerase sigma-70 factor (ECF subfamily)
MLHSSAEAPPADAIEDRVQLPEDFERLYSEHFEFVWRSLRRLGVRPEELDDAAQDVFIVYLRRRSEFRGQSSQRTWMFGIANNVAHEYRRKQQRAARAETVSETQFPARGPSPLDQASSSEALRLIDTFLASLDDNKRNVFILSELEQMSAPEIATALQVKLNTVYSRLRAAREAFAAFLQQSAGQP